MCDYYSAPFLQISTEEYLAEDRHSHPTSNVDQVANNHEEEVPVWSKLSEHEFSAECWDFRNTIAFWASCIFVEGSMLFTIGSIFMFPDLISTSNAELHEMRYKAWVDYSFMIGAWLFTIANYLVYFQVINKASRGTPRLLECCMGSNFVAVPKCETGHIACILNLFGSFFYNIQTMSSVYTSESDLIKFDFLYASMGAGGSFLFVLGAVLEGEHNGWRELTQHRWFHSASSLPVWMSVLNFFGALLFMLAYAIDYNHVADNSKAITTWVVALPFTVGSFFFIIGSWISMWMWKNHQFGLGFAEDMDMDPVSPKIQLGQVYPPDMKPVGVNRKQQSMMVVYLAAICVAYVKMGFLASSAESELTFTGLEGDWHVAWYLEGFQKILVYHCIVFLASAIHKTPQHPPFNYLLNGMRIVALYGFCSDVYILSLFASTDPDLV